MPNWIDTQNSPEALTYLLASTDRYRHAKRVFVLQLITLVGIPTTLSILKLLFSELAVYAALSGLILSLLDIFVVDRVLKGFLRQGALCQEAFDCDVLRLPWIDRTSGKRPHSTSFSEWARSQRTRTDIEHLKNWYPTVAGEIPVEFGRLICQISNCRWDSRLRRVYALMLVNVPVTIAIASLIIGVYVNPRFDALLLTLSALTPVVLWALRTWRAQADLVDATKSQHDDLMEVWRRALIDQLSQQGLDDEARMIQTEIFKRRRTSQPVFNWLYRWRRKEQEPDMREVARDFVQEFRRAVVPETS